MTITVKQDMVIRYTAKAILVRFVESANQLMLTTGQKPKQKEVWVPKSLIFNRDNWKRLEQMELPDWFCEEKIRW